MGSSPHHLNMAERQHVPADEKHHIDEAILSKNPEPGIQSPCTSTSSESLSSEFYESDDDHDTESTLADGTNFPESNVSFYDNGASISELGNAAFEKLAERQASDPKKDTDMEWARKWLVFVCKVFGHPGLRSLKRKMVLLRSSGGQGPPQQQSVPAVLQGLLDGIRAMNRHRLDEENEEYMKCMAKADVARAWQPIKACLDANDASFLELIGNSQDMQMLKQHYPDKTSEDLCKGWLALNYKPDAKKEGALDEKQLDEAWENVNHIIAVGEHLLVFENHFGSAVFLLFIKGWEHLFQHGNLALTREMMDDFLLCSCPLLPALIKNLDPIASCIDNDGGRLPRYGFEAPGALKEGNQSLESLLSLTEGEAT